MPWGLFSLALLLAYVLQTAVLQHFASAWLDLPLTLALVCGLMAPTAEARLAGWITGLAQDIGTDSPLGLHAFAAGLAVFALTALRELVNREVWWVRWLAALAVALPAQFLVQLHDRYVQGAAVTWGQMAGHALETALVAALLAALAPGLLRLLKRRRRYSVFR
jgi:rod shape-determining protein MreD